jgi:high affinity sulfate transporter 1
MKGTKLSNTLKTYIPALDWMPKYDRKFLKRDALAGITTGTVVIPSAMAYASLVGLPPEYGLYAAVVTLIVYFFFGTSKHLVVVPSSGPAALAGAGLLALGITSENQIIALAGMLAFLTGLLLIAARLVKLGFIANFISETVLIGFQFGLALYVISLQIGKVTGIPGGSGTFIDQVVYYLTHLSLISPSTLAFSLIGFAFLIVAERFLPKIPWKLILLVVATLSVIAFSLTDYGISVVGNIPNGLPEFVLPSTTGVPLTDLLPIVAGLFLIIFVEGISISKTFAREGKYRIDANQELLGYGAPNAITGLFQGMPVDASSSNTSIAYQTGGKTQLLGLFASLVIITVLLFFASFFSNLPSAIIGVIIIMAMLKLVNVKELVKVFKFDRIEFLFSAVTLLGVLFIGLLQGIFIGVGITFLALLYQSSKPYIATLGMVPGSTEFTDIKRHPENQKVPGILAMRVDGALFFPNLQRVSDEIMKRVSEEAPQAKLVVLSLSTTPYVDLGATKLLRELHEELKATGIDFRISDATGSVRDTINKAGLEETFGKIEYNDSVATVIEDWKKGRLE